MDRINAAKGEKEREIITQVVWSRFLIFFFTMHHHSTGKNCNGTVGQQRDVKWRKTFFLRKWFRIFFSCFSNRKSPTIITYRFKVTQFEYNSQIYNIDIIYERANKDRLFYFQITENCTNAFTAKTNVYSLFVILSTFPLEWKAEFILKLLESKKLHFLNHNPKFSRKKFIHPNDCPTF